MFPEACNYGQYLSKTYPLCHTGKLCLLSLDLNLKGF